MTTRNKKVTKRILFLGLSSGTITGPVGSYLCLEFCGRCGLCGFGRCCEVGVLIAPPVQLALQVLLVLLRQPAYLEFRDLKGEGRPEFGQEPFPCSAQ